MTQPKGGKKSPLEIEYHPKPPADDRRGETYQIGIEIASSHCRVAARATRVGPSLVPDDPLRRTGFYSVGYHPWQYDAQRDGERYRIPAAALDKVVAVVHEFLGTLEIPLTAVERICTGVIIAFDENGRAVKVDTAALEVRLALEFPGVDIDVANRTHAALEVERRYGAGWEIRPCNRFMYITISKNLNLDAAPGDGSRDGIFARGIRHATVNRSLLEELGTQWIDGYTLPPEPNCPICPQTWCLHSLASGQGMLALLDGDASAKAAAAAVAGTHFKGYAEDVGATSTGTGSPIHSAALFKAASQNETCERIVLQAGIAIGIAIFERVVSIGLLEPDLIVIGGTVQLGKIDEDQQPLAARRTIDGIMQRTLQHLLPKDQSPSPRVTRSRFAGYTGLLGLTVPVEQTV